VSPWVAALRAFRILRVLKLIRSWTRLQNFLVGEDASAHIHGGDLLMLRNMSLLVSQLVVEA